MEYRNKMTGALISTDCVISGGDWEPVKPAAAQPEEADPADAEEDEQDEALAASAKPAARRAAKKKEA